MEKQIPEAVHAAPVMPLLVGRLVAGLLLLCGGPVYLLLSRGGSLQPRQVLGYLGQHFIFREWQPGELMVGHLGNWLGLGKYPALWNILRGDMAWVGPRPLAADEVLPPADILGVREQVRPGLFSLARLRQQTRIDYADEWSCDLEQIACAGWRFDLGLIVRSLLGACYGPQKQLPVEGLVQIDTVRVQSLSMSDALAAIEARLDGNTGKMLQVAFVNPDCVNIARRDARYRKLVNHAGLVLADGIGMQIAGRMLQQPFSQNVNGTDLFPRLCERLAQRQGSLYLLGAQPGVAEAVAARVLQEYPGLRVLGARDGYFSVEEEAAVVADIHAAHPDVLLVAMGAPRQDCWIADHAARLGAGVAIGVGGLFDFYAGRIPRAPQWLRELGLEWAFRLMQEPGRMWRRYLIGNFSFLLAIAMQKLLGSANAQGYGVIPGPLKVDAAAGHGVLLALSGLASPLYRDAGVQPALLPLGDAPGIVRCIETLASLNCRWIDVIADEQVTDICEVLGDGKRWGCNIRLHRVNGVEQALARLAVLDLGQESHVWLARADYWLPAESMHGNRKENIWVETANPGLRWSGWSCLERGSFIRKASSLIGGSALLSPDLLAVAAVALPAPYRLDTPKHLLDAQARWLGRHWSVAETISERAPGLRISPRARIAEDAELRPPLLIAAGVVIGSGAIVGPNASIGEGVVIEGGAEVRNSVIGEGMYVSRGALIDQAIVQADSTISANWEVVLPAEQTKGVIGVLRAQPILPPALPERALALGLWLILLLPCAVSRSLGRTDICHRFVPGLRQVVLGELSLVGAESPQALVAHYLPAGWSSRFGLSKPGLLTPSGVFSEILDSEDARAWADLHWLLNPGWPERWRILRAYLSNVRIDGRK